MRRGKGAMVAITLAFLVVATFVYSLVLIPEEVSAYTPHAPIYIDGNADFTVPNGVTGGSGTAFDPYVIGGWEIDATIADGLVIRNTDAHFVIRDVYVHSGNANHGISLYNVTNGLVENATALNNWYGLLISISDNITVEYGNYSNGNWYGMYVSRSNNFTISHVNAHANDEWGIHLFWSNHGILTNNTVDGNLDNGVMLYSSTNITFTGNDVFGNNDQGFRAQNSANLRFKGNTISLNVQDGINLEDTTNVTITGNTINGDGVVIWGSVLSHYNSHTMTPDNHVNGKPLLYFKDTRDIVLDGIPVGQLLFANCTDVEARNLVIVDTDLGIEIAFTQNASVTSSTISNNGASISIDYSSNVAIIGNNVSSNNESGIDGVSSFNITIGRNNASNAPLWGVGFDSSTNITIDTNRVGNTQLGILAMSCTNLTITGNNISSNTNYGLVLFNSDNALVHHNNIINNSIQATDNLGSENAWDDGYPSGGNYWSDYGGLDQFSGPNQDQPGGDGKGDTPYVIDGNSQDRFPLMEPYTVPPMPPFAPQKLQAEAGDKQVTLTWNPPISDGGSPITNYRIYRGSVPGGEVFLVEIGNVLGHSDPGLINGQTYYYKVSAYNGVGEGPQSNEANATPTTVPGAPTALQASLTGNGFENVTITWSSSSDDGAGQKSVVRYEIYKNMTFDPNALGYSLTGSVPNGSTELTIKFVGEGDSNNYFYRVCAVDLNSLTNCSLSQAAKFTRPLSKGKNLISVPLDQSDYNIETVLQTVMWDNAWTYDSYIEQWKWSMKFKPYPGSLVRVNLSMGLWINVTEDSNLTIAGIVPSSTVIYLCQGWNLIGYPSFQTDYTIIDLKAASTADRIEGFDSSAMPYFLLLMSDSDTLQTGFGYWIRAESDTTWTVYDS